MKQFNVMKSADSDQHVGIWYVNNDVSQTDINEAVYAMFCKVGQEVIDLSTCFVDGNYTAAELGGKFFAGCDPIVNTPRVEDELCFKVGDVWKQNFPTNKIFMFMSEWEGVIGITPKNAHKFYCEQPDRTQIINAELKPYHRNRVLNPSKVSMKEYNYRIAKKFEVLGELVQRLTSEGMRKAMSVLTASNPWEKNYEMKDMARDFMRRKLWKDYGVEGSMPIPYCAADFKEGPVCWMDVDEDYVKELRDAFQQALKDYPAPSDIKVNGWVQFKDQENTTKKFRGKLLCENVFPRLSSDGQRIEWHVGLRTGRFSTTHHLATKVEPWVEPEKPSKKKGKKEHGAGSKGQEKTVNSKPSTLNSKPSPLSIEEKLRAALKRQLAA